jgi:oxygen-independent coproporphyrinogen-3 oxidase
VFFGGGTPTLLSVDDMRKITYTIKESFLLDNSVEFTMEANPGTVDYDKLSGFVSCGVNRFSIGLQTIHENELKKLGRIHAYDDFLSTYRNLRNLGVNNINVDIMFGIPNQTEASFAETVKTVSSFTPEHLSLYGLILEEGTPLYKSRNELILPDEDAECRMYYSAAEILAGLGYEHYEISSYARAGHYSRHNLRYWSLSPYLGFGVAAHSYFDGARFFHPADLSAYLKGDVAYYEYERDADTEADAYELAMLALRTRWGLDLSDYRARFGRSFTDGREERISRFVAQGYMIRSKDRLAFTERGIYLSLAILSEIL